jgi:hypothetical protein
MTLKSLIIAPLIILIILSTFYTLYQLQPINVTSTQSFNSTGINGNTITNGTSTTYQQAGNSYSISITTTLGIMAILAVCEIVGTLAGIQVFGSGLSETSVRIIYKTMGLTIVWSILSVNGFLALNTIPYAIGILGYFIMTLVYAIGVINTV